MKLTQESFVITLNNPQEEQTVLNLFPKLISSPSLPSLQVRPLMRYSMASFALIAGFFVSGFSSIAHTAEVPASPSQTAPTVQGQSFPTDGVYLFGQASKPDQIGKAYAVLEVRQGKVMGALYMPYSSFDCVQGKVQGNRLALNVTDSYERTVRPYAIALESNASIAMTGNQAAVPGLRLQGFHPLSSVSENDQRMLNTCKADFLKASK